MAKFQTARFHIDSGPVALFARVRLKMGTPRILRLHSPHFRERAKERQAPACDLRHFDPAKWELVTAEVRTDTCKFVNSAWRRVIAGRVWWIVIGLHDTIETVFESRKSGNGPDVVTGGALYEKVQRVNETLLAEGPTTPSECVRTCRKGEGHPRSPVVGSARITRL